MNEETHHLPAEAVRHIAVQLLANDSRGKSWLAAAGGIPFDSDEKNNARCLLTLLMLSASPSFAAEKTMILSVPGMNCPSCPYMIEQSISVVDGVQSADVKLEPRTCSVTDATNE